MASAVIRDVTLGFCTAAERYWLTVFPHVARELRHWRSRARDIPHPVLRQHALTTHARKSSHAEGAAAFAVLAPLRARSLVVRGVVAFQAMYDYLDTISEQPGSDHFQNGLHLHRALIAAIDRADPSVDYYAFHPHRADGGYLDGLIEACRAVCGQLPGHACALPALRRAAVRAMESQSYTHSAGRSGRVSRDAFATWAEGHTPQGCDLSWWETAAASGSSLVVHALLATAADGTVRAEELQAVEELYFPWGGALQGLLDSLADREEDLAAGEVGLVSQYASLPDAADGMHALAQRALTLSAHAPNGALHGVIVAGMAAQYVSALSHASAAEAAVARRVMDALGAPGGAALAILRLRRRLARAGSGDLA
jgi:tetraprenyl-beta-curcumene synthase